ncbi:MAG: hypothetical protein RL071_3152 [Pseudomonadota bacterium]
MLSLLLAAALSAPAAAQEVRWTFAGALQTDVRYGIDTIDVGEWYAPLTQEPGFIRNQNLINTKIGAKTDGARFFWDADFVMMGFPDTLDSTTALSRREKIDPFRFEVHNAYAEAWDLGGLRGLDMRVGQQKIQWGVGDQFNPTNNLNADDLEDPLLFGDQLGNVMARLDYTPIPNLSLSAVVVPVFKPALLPQTGRIALGLTDRIPVDDAALRRELYASNALLEEFALSWPTVVSGVSPQLPDNTFENMQWSGRIAGTLGLHDLALSYYKGRFDFPVATNNHSTAAPGDQCNPGDDEDCIKGLLQTIASVGYPEMQVWGFNAAGEVNPLGWALQRAKSIGYRLELARINPERQTMSVTNDELALGITTQAAGEYDYQLEGGGRPEVLATDSFWKWTAGLDYTFGKHVYVNAQWVHGMPDEFGAGDWASGGGGATQRQAELLTYDDPLVCNVLNLTTDPRDQGEQCVKEWTRPKIGDYGVIGTDLTFRQTTLRVFTILDFTPITVSTYDAEAGERVSTRFAWDSDTGRSMVIYPELKHAFPSGFSLSGGAVVMIGEPWTKFGDPATGGTQIFTRARYAF